MFELRPCILFANVFPTEDVLKLLLSSVSRSDFPPETAWYLHKRSTLSLRAKSGLSLGYVVASIVLCMLFKGEGNFLWDFEPFLS